MAGIDPGWRRLGVCILDLDSRRVVRWDTVPLFPEGQAFDELAVPARVLAVCREYGLADCLAVVIEGQLHRAPRMLMVQTAFAMALYDNAWVVPGLQCKRALQLCYGNRTANKRAVVNRVVEIVSTMPTTDAVGDFLADSAGKGFAYETAKDRADAFVQIMYYEEFNLALCADRTRFRVACSTVHCHDNK